MRLHPDYLIVRDDPKVAAASAALRKACVTSDGTAAIGGRAIKVAEYALMVACEDAIQRRYFGSAVR